MEAVFYTSDSYTRLDNATAYAAGDAISDNATSGTPLVFENAAVRAGRGGVIETLAVITDFATAAGDPGGLSAELWLFDTAPTGTTFEDNAAAALTYAEALNVVAVIPFDFDTDGHNGTAAGAGSAVAFLKDLSLPYRCALEGTSLYGVLIARNAYVPNNEQNITVQLGVQREYKI